MLWIAVKHIVVGLLRRVVDTGKLKGGGGSLLRAALGPKTRASLASVGLLQ